jgi:cytochrome c oxidase assembly factor 1
LGASAAALFNYQKASSSVVESTLYALRVHEQAREVLGDEITFKSKMPWISGKLSQLHGDIDISYSVKGTKGEGVMHFKCIRKGRMGSVSFFLWPCKVHLGNWA